MGFLLQISFSLFPLENVTFAIFAKDVPMMPTKHFWKDISYMHFIDIYLKYTFDKIFVKGSLQIVIWLMCQCLWSEWKWRRGVKNGLPFPWCPANRECLWKKTQIEIKQEKILGGFWITEIALLKNFFLSDWRCGDGSRIAETSNIVFIGVSNPPQKHHTLLFSPSPPLKSANCPSPPFSGNSPYILVFRELPPLKIGFFSEPS